ncbi:MAG: hypothetical protein M3P34_04850, partial [Actinomycetota bacterium]|nr:hypothetical protein [Actinomycetota bacterium]
RVRQAGSLAEADEPVRQQTRPGVDRPAIVGREHQVVHDLVPEPVGPSRRRCWRIIAAIVAPTVNLRVRLDFVGPSTSSDRFRSIVSTRPRGHAVARWRARSAAAGVGGKAHEPALLGHEKLLPPLPS